MSWAKAVHCPDCGCYYDIVPEGVYWHNLPGGYHNFVFRCPSCDVLSRIPDSLVPEWVQEDAKKNRQMETAVPGGL